MTVIPGGNHGFCSIQNYEQGMLCLKYYDLIRQPLLFNNQNNESQYRNTDAE